MFRRRSSRRRFPADGWIGTAPALPRSCDDRGAATALSMFPAIPFLILFTFGTRQIVFVWHANNILERRR